MKTDFDIFMTAKEQRHGAMYRLESLVLASCALVLASIASPALAQRVALVVGNSAYRHEATLRNPVNDARLIAKTLREAPLQFDEVIEVKDATRADLLNALARFNSIARHADAAFIYYSGHGMINSKRQNHLLPVEMPRLSSNASLDADTALKTYGVTEDELIESIEGAKVQIVVLDACRDNGFDPARKGTAKGLARRSEASRNRLLAYATEEGRTAEDGNGSNSTYAMSLAQNLHRADWPLLRVFDEVASDVETATKGRQLPSRSGNLRTDVYLLPAVAAQGLAAAQPVALPNPIATATGPMAAPRPIRASELTLVWPAQGDVIAYFDEFKNKGISIQGRTGDSVFAAADGRVVYAGNGLRGYGNLIIIKHDDNHLTAYAHNESLQVREDQNVRQGQRIAQMGQTETDRVKLHFEVRRNGKSVDPMGYLPQR